MRPASSHPLLCFALCTIQLPLQIEDKPSLERRPMYYLSGNHVVADFSEDRPYQGYKSGTARKIAFIECLNPEANPTIASCYSEPSDPQHIFFLDLRGLLVCFSSQNFFWYT